jgi:hypothetical protein
MSAPRLNQLPHRPLNTDERSDPVTTTMRITEEQRREIRSQIGGMVILSISGGRVHPLPDGIELPVSNGFKVRVRLTPADTYTVERVFKRGNKEFPHGERTDVYCDEVSDAAYYAGMFRSYGYEGPDRWQVQGR